MSSTPDEREPDAPTEPEPAHDKRSVLRFALGLKGVRAQVVIAVLLAILGFAAAVQVRLTHSDEDFSGQRREELIELLDSLSAATDRAQGQIDELQATRLDLLSSSERRQAALEAGQQQLEVLQILAGTAPATGPGVTITIDDPNNAVTADEVLNGIEELRVAGAEAIEINDSVRLVASSSFTSDAQGVISVDGIEIRPPYVLDVIGSSHDLERAVVFRGGLSDVVERAGGTVSVDASNSVEVGSLHAVVEPQYSSPTDE